MTSGRGPVRTQSVLAAALVWLVVAIAVGASGVLATLGPPVPQLILLGLTAACLAVLVGVRRIRAWALAVDQRVLVAFHLSRFVGLYFLALYARGELPYAFAVVGGWGDIVVALLALGLLIAGPATGWRRAAYAMWNALGLADILFVVGTAARSGMADPGSMRALQHLPLSLLPTYVVPIVVVTHLVLGYRFLRLRAADASTPAR
jgi:hypothetical protein